MANIADLDKAAHYEPPNQDLRCLQIILFSSWVLKVVKAIFQLQSQLYLHTQCKSAYKDFFYICLPLFHRISVNICCAVLAVTPIFCSNNMSPVLAHSCS